MLEHAGALPTEGALLQFPGGDKLVMALNVQSTGQAHATVFGRVLAEKLGIDRERIEHRHGDSAFEIPGFASVGSRSAMAASHAIVHTADVMLAKGKKIAAALLEASEGDIQYGGGNFSVVGTDRKISLFETAARAKEMNETLDTKEKADTPLTFPNGVHIAEVEIDPDTGHLDLVRYTAVDDCGNMLNPMVVEGQVQGSLANGLGQALTENAVYDARRPARHRLVHGLRHAARARHADRIPRGDALRAGDDQPARRQGHRRGRHHGGDRRGDERDRARDPERRRRSHGHAGDAREGVGSVPEGDSNKIAPFVPAKAGTATSLTGFPLTRE